MNYTREQTEEFLLASDNVHYFASLCLPEIYKQQTHLLDTYSTDKNSFAIVARQCGVTTIQAVYVLWRLIFTPQKTIAYTTVSAILCEAFIDKIIELNDKLPEHLKAKFEKVSRYTLVSDIKTRVIAKPMNSNAFRGMTISTLIIDLFHFVKKSNFYDFMSAVYPTMAASNGKVIMSTNINSKGYKLYELIRDFNIDDNYWISVIPFNKCTQYSELKDARLKTYLTAEDYQSSYCCIDQWGIDYAQ